MRTFLTLWIGQSASLIGSALTSFALGVWVYQQTGSITQLALVYLLVFLPGIVVAPITGALVDRFDRRTALVTTNTVGLVSALALATLYTQGALQPWHIYITTGIASVLAAVQTPAVGASVGLLVGRDRLGRANGLVMLSQAVAQIIGPLAGGYLFATLGLSGVILLDALSFVVSLVCLLIVRLPRPKPTPAESTTAGAPPSTLLSETAASWSYVAARRGLVALLTFYALLNFAVGFVDVLVTPIVLGFAPPQTLGVVLGIGGVGMVVGSIVMSAWGGPQKRIHGVLTFSIILGVALCCGSLRPNVTLLAAAAFVFLFCSAIINASNRSIWQAKVEPAMQGRVISLENMVATAPLPIAYLLAGPLADHVLRPRVAAGGEFSRFAAALVGAGDDRATSLLLLAAGLLAVAVAVAGYLYRPLRRLDTELADAIPSVPAEASREHAPTPKEPPPEPRPVKP